MSEFRDILSSFSEKMAFKPDWRMHFINLQQPGDYNIPIRYFQLIQSNVLYAMTKEAIINNINIFDVQIDRILYNANGDKILIEDFAKKLESLNLDEKTLYWNEKEGYYIDTLDTNTVIFYSKTKYGFDVRILTYKFDMTKIFDSFKKEIL